MSTASQIRGAVHTNTRHDSAHNHVTGQSVFIDDMPLLAGTLHAALVKSSHAHARIKSIDITKGQTILWLFAAGLYRRRTMTTS